MLSSCSLVGLYVNLQVKVTEEKKKNSEYFSGECLKLKLRLQKKLKLKKNVGVVDVSLSWASCGLKSSITWANWKVKVKIAVGNKMIACYGKI